jgi:hypothetical protein
MPSIILRSREKTCRLFIYFIILNLLRYILFATHLYDCVFTEVSHSIVALIISFNLLSWMRQILNRCDLEFAARLQQKNEHSVSLISGMCDYKRILLKYIATKAPREVG